MRDSASNPYAGYKFSAKHNAVHQVVALTGSTGFATPPRIASITVSTGFAVLVLGEYLDPGVCLLSPVDFFIVLPLANYRAHRGY
jgi:hypothetical protein